MTTAWSAVYSSKCSCKLANWRRLLGHHVPRKNTSRTCFSPRERFKSHLFLMNGAQRKRRGGIPNPECFICSRHNPIYRKSTKTSLARKSPRLVSRRFPLSTPADSRQSICLEHSRIQPQSTHRIVVDSLLPKSRPASEDRE